MEGSSENRPEQRQKLTSEALFYTRTVCQFPFCSPKQQTQGVFTGNEKHNCVYFFFLNKALQYNRLLKTETRMNMPEEK